MIFALIKRANQRKKSKSLAYRIFNAKKAEKDELYPELLRCASLTFKQSRDCPVRQQATTVLLVCCYGKYECGLGFDIWQK